MAERRWVPTVPGPRVTAYLPPAAILLVQQVLYPLPAGVLVRGVLVGSVTALIALGMALIYRSNRIVNFAQGDLGAAPAVLVFLLLTEWGWPYPLAVAAGAVGRLRPRRHRRAGRDPPLLPGAATRAHGRHHRAGPAADRDRRLPPEVVRHRGLVPRTPHRRSLRRPVRAGRHDLPGQQRRRRSWPRRCWSSGSSCSCAAPRSASPSGRRPTGPTGPRCSVSR